MQDRTKYSLDEYELLSTVNASSLHSHELALKISKIVNQMKSRKTNNINAKNKSGMTALHILIGRGEKEAAKVLLDEKVDLGLLTDKGETALHLAILGNHDDCASLLIEAGAELEKINASEITPFSYAVLNNNFNITSQLIKYNVKITHPLMLEMLVKQQDANDPRVRCCLDALNKQYPNRNQVDAKPTSTTSSEVVIIPFMLDTNNHYETLSAGQKIDLLVTRIDEVCEILKKQKPNATWIIGWREYGIRDVGRRSISDDDRRKLKDAMKAMSHKHPNLVIIAGTILTRKEKKIADLDKILRYYDDLSWLDITEKSQSDSKEPQHLAFHRNQITQLQKKQLDKDQKIIVTANKARIYYRGIETRHGKIAPYNETMGLGELAVYQPGKGKNLNPIARIDNNLSIAISICREMQPGFDFIKKSHTKDDTPTLHFILSHTIPLPLVSIDATHAALHFDRCYDPLFVLPRKSKKANVDITVYPISVHEKVERFNYSVKPIYPAQFQILDRIDQERSKSPNFLEKIGLEAIQNKTMKLLFKFFISEENYQQYISYIKSRAWLLKPTLVADIISIIQQSEVQHTFTLSLEKKSQAIISEPRF